MDAIIAWATAHLWLVVAVVYEVWSLIPSDTVRSSSILTWIGVLINTLRGQNPPPQP